MLSYTTEKLSNKKFYAILMNEVGRDEMDPPAEKRALAARPVYSSTLLSEHAPKLYSALMARRNFAVACLTPEKLARASAKDLVIVIDKLTDMMAEAARFLPKEVTTKNNIQITDEERKRIEQLVGGIDRGAGKSAVSEDCL
jgi:hypothetical protein